MSSAAEKLLINGVTAYQDGRRRGKEVGRDEEEDIEQSGSCQGGRLLV
jgi:hypothetical protein